LREPVVEHEIGHGKQLLALLLKLQKAVNLAVAAPPF
jgi:hypothetical protein